MYCLLAVGKCTPGKAEKQPAPLLGGRVVRWEILLERDNSRHEPLVPHLVDLALEEFDVFVDKVREPSLLEQVVAHRQALEFPFGNLFRLAVESQLAAFDLIQRPNAGVDGQFAELD